MEGLPSVLRPASTQEVVDRLRAERAGSPFLLFRDGDRHQRIVAVALTGAFDARRDELAERVTAIADRHPLYEHLKAGAPV